MYRNTVVLLEWIISKNVNNFFYETKVLLIGYTVLILQKSKFVNCKSYFV